MAFLLTKCCWYETSHHFCQLMFVLESFLVHNFQYHGCKWSIFLLPLIGYRFSLSAYIHYDDDFGWRWLPKEKILVGNNFTIALHHKMTLPKWYNNELFSLSLVETILTVIRKLNWFNFASKLCFTAYKWHWSDKNAIFWTN